MTNKKAVIIGPYGVGKTMLFEALVKKSSIYSKYFPGTEVTISKGDCRINKQNWTLIDLPAVASLNPLSLNEQIVLNTILEEKPEVVLQVMTLETVKQNIMLSIHLSELGIPFIIIINKKDSNAYLDYELDLHRLYGLFHANIIEVSVVLDEKLRDIKNLFKDESRPRWVGQFNARTTQIIEGLESKLERIFRDKKIMFSKRFIVVMLILKNGIVKDWLKKQVGNSFWKEFEKKLEGQRAYAMAESIQNEWEKIGADLSRQLYAKKEFGKTKMLTSLSKYTYHPVWGGVILLFVLGIIFMLLSKFAAGFLVSFIETELFSKYVTPGFVSFITQFPIAPIVKDFFIGDYGLFTMGLTYLVAIIFPITFVLFTILAVLEDSGYLSHASIVVARVFNKMGLSSLALPVFALGLSCTVLAVSKAKILKAHGQFKVATFILVLAVPCIAQLGIIINMLSVIPPYYALIFCIIFLLHFFSLGFLFKRSIYKVKKENFQEVYNLRKPSLRNVWQRVSLQTKWYFRKAVPFFFLATVFLFFAEEVGILALLQRMMEPVVTFVLGLPVQTVEVFVLGFFRRDYGAARLYELTNNGSLNAIQVLVSLLIVTLSIPCITVFFVLIKEHGFKIALSIGLAIFFYTLTLGSFVNMALRF